MTILAPQVCLANYPKGVFPGAGSTGRVYCHGSGGNRQAYVLALARWASAFIALNETRMVGQNKFG
mgnify:CR=1 FL=1